MINAPHYDGSLIRVKEVNQEIFYFKAYERVSMYANYTGHGRSLIVIVRIQCLISTGVAVLIVWSLSLVYKKNSPSKRNHNSS